MITARCARRSRRRRAVRAIREVFARLAADPTAGTPDLVIGSDITYFDDDFVPLRDLKGAAEGGHLAVRRALRHQPQLERQVGARLLELARVTALGGLQRVAEVLDGVLRRRALKDGERGGWPCAKQWNVSGSR